MTMSPSMHTHYRDNTNCGRLLCKWGKKTSCDRIIPRVWHRSVVSREWPTWPCGGSWGQACVSHWSRTKEGCVQNKLFLTSWAFQTAEDHPSLPVCCHWTVWNEKRNKMNWSLNVCVCACAHVYELHISVWERVVWNCSTSSSKFIHFSCTKKAGVMYKLCASTYARSTGIVSDHKQPGVCCVIV